MMCPFTGHFFSFYVLVCVYFVKLALFALMIFVAGVSSVYAQTTDDQTQNVADSRCNVFKEPVCGNHSYRL